MTSDFDQAATQRDAEVTQAAALQAERAAVKERAMENLAKLGGEGRLKGSDDTAQYRAFFAPTEKNTRFLVKAGEYEVIKDPNSPRGTRMTERTGDIWLQFIDGIAVLNEGDAQDQVRIQWCEQNENICRDIADPMTEAWAYMKELQKPTSWRDATLNPNIDIERLLRGDASGNRVPHRAVDHAREQVAKANEG